MKNRLALLPLACCLALALPLIGQAAENATDLPPSDVIVRLLRQSPAPQVSAHMIRAEEANQRRLEAGHYEWNIRLGSQQLRSRPSNTDEQRYREWNAALERPLRLPGKTALDSELGAKGVDIARTAHGDSLHETSRDLLKSWFLWLKESASASQWQEQVKILSRQAQSVVRRQQLGDASALDAQLAEAAKAQAEAQMAQASVRQRSAAEDLRRRFPGLPLQAPSQLSEPTPLKGNADEWISAILEHSHELGLARGEMERARLYASRAERDKIPDPTVGFHVSRERSGEDRVLGAYLSIPLPGTGRRAHSEVMQAQAMAANSQEAAVLQKISAEAAMLYQNTEAAFSTWQASRQAAEHLDKAADMTQRAYQLGEGSLSDLLNSRRQANEASLATRLQQLDALELRYRLLLDAHQLWDLD
jgi:outer membrane protein TolC